MRRAAGRLLALFFQVWSALWCVLRGGAMPRSTIGVRTVLLGSGIQKNESADNELRIGANCTIRQMKISFSGKGGKVIIGDHVRIYEGVRIEVDGDDCTLMIGRKTTIGQAALFLGESGTRITVGEDNMWSRDIRVSTSDYHSILEADTGQRINPASDVELADRVWVGNGVIISKGSRIARETVIASRAVVAKAYPENNTIIAGVPGRVIRKNIEWRREQL